jgi:glutamate carboxypeptidase
MIKAAHAADVVLSFESGEAGVVVTSRRGYTSWQLSTTGKQAHSGSIFTESVGAGAIFEASRILNQFYDQVRGDPKLTFNAGAIAGGTEAKFDPNSNSGTLFGKENVVPKTAIVVGEIRAVSAEQDARTQAKMQAIVAAHLPGTGAGISFRGQFAPMEARPGNLELQKQYSAISVALGAGPLLPNDPVTRGAGDISFVANLVPQALDGLGGAGEGAHSTQEYVDLNSFRIATQRAAILIARLTAPR